MLFRPQCSDQFIECLSKFGSVIMWPVLDHLLRPEWFADDTGSFQGPASRVSTQFFCDILDSILHPELRKSDSCTNSNAHSISFWCERYLHYCHHVSSPSAQTFRGVAKLLNVWLDFGQKRFWNFLRTIFTEPNTSIRVAKTLLTDASLDDIIYTMNRRTGNFLLYDC